MKWNEFIERINNGLLDIFFLIPKETISDFLGANITQNTYATVMVGIWLVIFFIIWLTIFIIYKMVQVIF